MNPFGFIFLALVAFVVSTKIEVGVLIVCLAAKKWPICYTLTLIETDISKHDVLAQTETRCTSTDEHWDTIIGYENNDGFLDWDLELQVILKHNCSQWGIVEERKSPEYEVNVFDSDKTAKVHTQFVIFS